MNRTSINSLLESIKIKKQNLKKNYFLILKTLLKNNMTINYLNFLMIQTILQNTEKF